MRQLVEDTLHLLEPEISYSQEAVELVLGTIAQESAYGKYHKQINGPALGIAQCEPATFNDVLENYLAYNTDLLSKIVNISRVDRLNSADLETNDILAICMCRVHYLRKKGAIPDDLQGQAEYWKQYYNTPKGKGTIREYIDHYKFYVLGEALI